MKKIAELLELKPDATEDEIIAAMDQRGYGAQTAALQRALNERTEARIEIAKLTAAAELVAPHARKAAPAPTPAPTPAPAATTSPAAP